VNENYQGDSTYRKPPTGRLTGAGPTVPTISARRTEDVPKHLMLLTEAIGSLVKSIFAFNQEDQINKVVLAENQSVNCLRLVSEPSPMRSINFSLQHGIWRRLSQRTQRQSSDRGRRCTGCSPILLPRTITSKSPQSFFIFISQSHKLDALRDSSDLFDTPTGRQITTGQQVISLVNATISSGKAPLTSAPFLRNLRTEITTTSLKLIFILAVRFRLDLFGTDTSFTLLCEFSHLSPVADIFAGVHRSYLSRLLHHLDYVCTRSLLQVWFPVISTQ